MAPTNTTKIGAKIAKDKNAAAKDDKIVESTSTNDAVTGAAAKKTAPAKKDDTKKDETSNDRKRRSDEEGGNTVDSKRARSDEAADKSSKNTNDSSKEEKIIDKAVELGFKPGDRLEVEWEVERQGTTMKHNWGAKLLPYDGRSKEGFAIRRLDYDPFLEGGYPERTQEDVVFVTQYIILNAENGAQLNFKREGADDIVDFQEEDLNTMLTNAMEKNSAAWGKLDPAQQRQMGTIIATGKERLLEAITRRFEEKPGTVITSEEIPGILEKAFEGM